MLQILFVVQRSKSICLKEPSLIKTLAGSVQIPHNNMLAANAKSKYKQQYNRDCLDPNLKGIVKCNWIFGKQCAPK